MTPNLTSLKGSLNSDGRQFHQYKSTEDAIDQRHFGVSILFLFYLKHSEFIMCVVKILIHLNKLSSICCILQSLTNMHQIPVETMVRVSKQPRHLTVYVMLDGLGRFVTVRKLICDSSLLLKILRTVSIMVSMLGSRTRRVKTKTTTFLFDTVNNVRLMF